MANFTRRWISSLGISTLCFGIALFVLRIPVRTIGIFFAIGIPLILLWLYVDEKSKQQKKQIGNYSHIKIQKQVCICSICNHEQAGTCFDQKCACCLLMKGDKIIGHSINPLQ